MLGLCRVLLRNRDEAEDAVQQTFLAAYRSLLNGVEPRHPAAWLATIARNECWALISRRMREPITEAEPVSTLPDTVAVAAARADLAELWSAIRELPQQQRQALLLREFSGLSYDELAEALAVSEPAVESLLFRARRQLRFRLRSAESTAAGIAPLAAIREALARAIGGMPDPSSAGLLAKVASAPLVAKLAAGAAAVVVTGGSVAAVESGVVSKRQADVPARASIVSAATADLAGRPTAARPSAVRAHVARPSSRKGESPIPSRPAPVAAAASPGHATQPSSGVETLETGSEGDPASPGTQASASPGHTPPQTSGGKPATGDGQGPESAGGGGSGQKGSEDDHGSSSGGGEGSGSGSSGSDDSAGDDGGGSPGSASGSGGDDHNSGHEGGGDDSGGGDSGGSHGGDGGGDGGDGGGDEGGGDGGTGI